MHLTDHHDPPSMDVRSSTSITRLKIKIQRRIYPIASSSPISMREAPVNSLIRLPILLPPRSAPGQSLPSALRNSVSPFVGFESNPLRVTPGAIAAGSNFRSDPRRPRLPPFPPSVHRTPAPVRHPALLRCPHKILPDQPGMFRQYAKQGTRRAPWPSPVLLPIS